MPRTPPLVVWIGVALVCTVLFGVLQWAGARMSAEQGEALLYTQQARLRDYLTNTGAPRVVMIGTSIGRAALPFSQVPGNPPIPWLHINQNGRRFTLMTHLLPTLLEHPPELFIVQTELLLSEGSSDPPEPLSVTIRRNLLQWRKIGGSLKRSKPAREQRYRREAQALQERLASYGEGTTWQKVYDTALPLKTRFRRTQAMNPEITAFLHAVASRGSRILLIDVPRSPSFESAFGEDEDFWLHNVIAQLKDIPGLRLWRLPMALGDECYSDYLHLRPACRHELEPALMQLANYIRDQMHD